MPFNTVSNSSLRLKIIGLCFSFALIGTLFLAVLNHSKNLELAEANVETILSADSLVVSTRLREELLTLVEDARVVSLTPPIRGIVRASENEGIDPFDGSTEELWRSRLSTIFTSLLGVRSHYSQMRYIEFANNGRELVRVNRIGSSVFTVPMDELQHKGEEPYMRQAMQLQPGEASFSEITQNRENGEVDPNGPPTLRVMLPVFDSMGHAFGVIVINADYRALVFDVLNETKPAFDTYVLDASGDVVAYDGATQTPEFMFPESVPGDLATSLMSLRQNEMRTLQSSDDNYAIADRLDHLLPNSEFHLDIVVQGKRSELFAGVRNAQWLSVILTLILLVGLSAVAAILAARLTRPLKKMTDSIELYASDPDNQELVLPTDAGTEIGALSRSFTHLIGELNDAKKMKRNVIDYAVDGLIVITQTGVIKTFNPACEDIFGYKSQDVLGRNIKMLMPPASADKHDQYLAEAKSDVERHIIGRTRTISARKADGTDFPVEISISRFTQGDQTYFCGVVRDISDIVKANNDLAEQKRTLDLTMEGGRIGTWSFHVMSGRIDFCERSAALLGYSAEELGAGGLNWYRMIEPSQYERVMEELRAFIVGDTHAFETEYKMQKRTGDWIWVQSRATVSDRDAQGFVTRLTGLHFDITERKSSELETIENNRQLELAETVAEMGHWSMDGATGELYWSEGIYRIHGLSSDSMDPNVDDAVQHYHPDDRAAVAEFVQEATMNGTPFSFQMRLIRPDGEIRHVLSKGDCFPNPDNPRRFNVFGIFQDVTDKVITDSRLAASEEKTRLVLENIVDGVLTVNEDGLIDTCNPACASIFGYEGDELIGQPLTILVPDEFADAHRAGFRRDIETGESRIIGKTLELEGVRKGGERFALELAISRSELGGQNIFTGILRDITERKNMETMKNEFVSTVSHELRTPLTSIYGSLDLLKGLSNGKLDPKCERLVSLAHDGCGRLSNLVNDILDVEKIAAGKMEYAMEDVELKPLITSIVEGNEALAQRFGVNFVLDQHLEDHHVKMDPARFTQAMVNLLSNAAKFSPSGGDVIIRTQRISAHTVRIGVTDFGPGIPKAFQDRIFERFSQATGLKSPKQAGTGLGLNITKSIIEAFNGQVSFETQEGVGTTFYFDLPIHGQRLAPPHTLAFAI